MKIDIVSWQIDILLNIPAPLLCLQKVVELLQVLLSPCSECVQLIQKRILSNFQFWDSDMIALGKIWPVHRMFQLLTFGFWPVIVIELNRTRHNSDGGVVWKAQCHDTNPTCPSKLQSFYWIFCFKFSNLWGRTFDLLLWKN